MVFVKIEYTFLIKVSKKVKKNIIKFDLIVKNNIEFLF